MNQLKSMTLNLVASSILIGSFCVWAAPTRAQSDAPPNPPEQTMASDEEFAGADGADWGSSAACQPWPEKIGLSDEQMEKLVSLKSEYEVKTAQQKAELMSDMKKMGLLMTDSKIDRQAILSLHEKINSIKSDLCTARVNHMIDAAEVMTPKQREDMRHHMLMHMLSHHGMHDMKHHGFEHHHG